MVITWFNGDAQFDKTIGVIDSFHLYMTFYYMIAMTASTNIHLKAF
jgi:hypothetical protein